MSWNYVSYKIIQKYYKKDELITPIEGSGCAGGEWPVSCLFFVGLISKSSTGSKVHSPHRSIIAILIRDLQYVHKKFQKRYFFNEWVIGKFANNAGIPSNLLQTNFGEDSRNITEISWINKKAHCWDINIVISACSPDTADDKPKSVL